MKWAQEGYERLLAAQANRPAPDRMDAHNKARKAEDYAIALRQRLPKAI